jgi:broad specificity phosphatase PhoE
MSTCLLIRHALTSASGTVMTGRSPGVHLSDEGARQAQRLAKLLRCFRVQAIYSSPLERAQETAGVIAQGLELSYEISEALTEVDFGSWTGLSLEELDRMPQWRRFNTLRSVTPAPSGEFMLQAQARIVRVLECLRARHKSQLFAVVSHADVIRAAMAHFLGIPLDLVHRLDISPASISAVAMEEDYIGVLGINHSASYYALSAAPELTCEPQ